jgi:hypothetical protein
MPGGGGGTVFISFLFGAEHVQNAYESAAGRKCGYIPFIGRDPH